MSPRPKPVPKRLGPPPQLSQLAMIPMVQQRKKFQPKMRELVAKRVKKVARWLHENFTWKKILMSWMVILVASKMILLMLTYEFFSLTALVSLQIFHGVWSVAFFCLNIVDSRAILPNASCLLAGYLPATTVLHILLIPNDYPLEFIITDAIGTFLAIVTMFLLLRMECTEILHEAEEMWNRQQTGCSSEDGSEIDSVTSSSAYSNGSGVSTAVGVGTYMDSDARTLLYKNNYTPSRMSALSPPTAYIGAAEPLTPVHHGNLDGKRIPGVILSELSGPTIIRVNGVSTISGGQSSTIIQHQQQQPFDSMYYCTSLDESEAKTHTEVDGRGLFDEAVDLEPIDFEHFVDEPDLERNHRSERMFRVTFGETPPPRGR